MVIACLGLLVACDEGDGHTADPSDETTLASSGAPLGAPSDDTASGPSTPPTSAPVDGDEDAGPTSGAEAGFTADTSPDEATASDDALLTVTDVRAAVHDGYERVVLELGGTGTPGWRAEYVDEAVQDGSGNVVDVAGGAILSVQLSGTGYPVDTGLDEFSGDPLASTSTDLVTDVVLDGTFEGYTQVFVGLDEVHPFRVFLLEDPVRVVVDVRTD
ncbi:AMIN-like domain-containing (lipo)protein [Sediminihabitans luteus]|uniref:AMIN-like domain-containing (lipo)protein n=1 Tax=Sediminihabitans luteus TaxID=1138585 RepID=UPI0014761EEF|nr:hypothetical protein [Sediminihabitans luteus]